MADNPRVTDTRQVSTWPTTRTLARMADLKADAIELTVPGKLYENHRARYLATIGPIRPMLLDDQVKLNDAGASEYLIETLARDGWDGLLRFYEGEVWRLRNRPGDDIRADQSYAAAVAFGMRRCTNCRNSFGASELADMRPAGTFRRYG